jgi:hypothetical protein
MSTEMSPVIVNGLQELVKVILMTKLNSLSIYNESSIACQDALHCIEPSEMQETGKFNNLMFI